MASELETKYNRICAELEQLKDLQVMPGRKLVTDHTRKLAHGLVMSAFQGLNMSDKVDPSNCVAAVAQYGSMMDDADMVERMIKRREADKG